MDLAANGRSWGPFPVVLDRTKAGEFAEILGVDDPLVSDEGAASAGGYRAPLAPLTFPFGLAVEGQPFIPDVLSCRYDRTVLSGYQYDFVRPLPTGVPLLATTRIVAAYEHEGKKGRVAIGVAETEFADEDGNVCTRQRATFIERLD